MTYKRLDNIEATCPNCDMDIIVELPEDVVYPDPEFPEKDWEKLLSLAAGIREHRYFLAELYSFRNEIANSWRNRRAWKLLNGRIKRIDMETQDLETERYHLYNKLNPPVGENSTD